MIKGLVEEVKETSIHAGLVIGVAVVTVVAVSVIDEVLIHIARLI